MVWSALKKFGGNFISNRTRFDLIPTPGRGRIGVPFPHGGMLRTNFVGAFFLRITPPSASLIFFRPFFQGGSNSDGSFPKLTQAKMVDVTGIPTGIS
ncbi:hypothetical protein M5689_002960 [Euphorbia peplus]|nr:hypothetical protein M5689_002960 [Euphorbia peplus]